MTVGVTQRGRTHAQHHLEVVRFSFTIPVARRRLARLCVER
jgi:hypothetical protein